jgi:regulator of sirC expression with transglutaminase-like and TPR domain
MPPADPGPLTAGNLDGLVRLLADDDERIRRIARENLSAAGERAFEVVRDRARLAEDPRVRHAAEEFLLESLRREAVEAWCAAAASPSIDLEEGAFLVARSEHPAIDIPPYRAVLDGYSEVLHRRLSALRSSAAIVDRMNALLFREVGYKGNRERPHEPENSILDSVIDRKLGSPLSLSILYLLVARRINLKLEGVGLPGHFLLRYKEGRRSSFLDPWSGGQPWTHGDCVAYLEAEGMPFQEEYLRPASDREILLRLLEDLLRIHHAAGSREPEDRVTGMLAALRRKGSKGIGGREAPGG